MKANIGAILFDLDGTLIDSANDLAAAVNDLLELDGMEPLPIAHLRPHAGSGARGMLAQAYRLEPHHPEYEAKRDAFYLRYSARMLETTQLFRDVDTVLSCLESVRLPWGIVTNKAMRFAAPQAQLLGLKARASVLVAGDSTPHTKPHPAPLLAAAEQMNLPPSACVYVGDDPRDVVAGRAAGMRTLAAAWGYLGPDLPAHEWGADYLLDQPQDLLKWLELA